MGAVLVQANYQGCPVAKAGDKATAADATAASALRECRRLNGRLQGAQNAEELFAALAQGWQALDCINLAAALHRLASLAEAAPGGAATFCRRWLLGDPRWAWLLDQVLAAAAAPSFGPQCVANSLAALSRLDALSPQLLQALHAPLLRALAAPAAADRLTTQGLTQVLSSIARDLPSLKPLILRDDVRARLWEALWAAAPQLDAQGVAAAWAALGELSSGCSPHELQLGAEAPDLLPRLAAAAKAAADGLTILGMAQVLHACAKMRPQHRDEALLQRMAAAIAARLEGGQERPSPEAASRICLSFGRLGFQPRCHWSPQRLRHVNVLDDVGTALVAGLPVAKPQAACGYLVGLGLLNYAPPAPVLSALLQHLGSSQRCQRPADAGAETGYPTDGASTGTGTVGGSGHGQVDACPAAALPGEGGSDGLVLQRLSSQKLADLVCSLRRILSSAGGQAYPDSLLPPAVVESFFDALDTVLHARACLATRFSPGATSQLALTGQHVGALLHALGRLAATWPCAVLVKATLSQLERHLLANPYSGDSLASFLQFYALTSLHPGPLAVEALCERALALLLPARELPQPLRQQPRGFSLGALARLLAALAALRINRPRLLCALLPAAAAALAEGEQEGSASAAAARPASLREMVSLAAALGQLQAAGLFAPADLASADALLPLWRQLMRQMASAASAAHGGALQPEDAALVQQAAMQLNSGVSAGRPAFWLPPAVSRALAGTPQPARQQQP
ncbi:hypothetical protein ABPG75_006443 [Micractinium tetrahymenae]